MKTANLIINWLLFHATCHCTERLTSPFDQIWRQVHKDLNFQTFELEKNWKRNLDFSKILISHPFYELGKTWKYRQPQTNISKSKYQILNLWISWKNLCPNLSFTVENKVGNSHKKGWSHFKLNINDWDIPFSKILRIYQ